MATKQAGRASRGSSGGRELPGFDTEKQSATRGRSPGSEESFPEIKKRFEEDPWSRLTKEQQLNACEYVFKLLSMARSPLTAVRVMWLDYYRGKPAWDVKKAPRDWISLAIVVAALRQLEEQCRITHIENSGVSLWIVKK